MPMFKRILFAALLAFTVIPLSAQEKADTTFVFRFPVESDTLFAAYHNNIAELRRMYDLVERHKPQILNGDIPLLVDGYCNSKNSTPENQAIAKIRSNRVKSELIVHTGLTEACFITQNHVEKGDFVTVRITIAKDDIPSTLPEKDTATPVENKKEEVVVAPFSDASHRNCHFCNVSTLPISGLICWLLFLSTHNFIRFSMSGSIGIEPLITRIACSDTVRYAEDTLNAAVRGTFPSSFLDKTL